MKLDFHFFFGKVLNSKPTSKVLARLAKKIPDSWRELGTELDVDNETITSILTNNDKFQKPEQKADEMLLKWSQMTDASTYGKLEEALKEIGRHDLAVWLIDGESAQGMDKICFLSHVLFFFPP